MAVWVAQSAGTVTPARLKSMCRVPGLMMTWVGSGTLGGVAVGSNCIDSGSGSVPMLGVQAPRSATSDSDADLTRCVTYRQRVAKTSQAGDWRIRWREQREEGHV